MLEDTILENNIRKKVVDNPYMKMLDMEFLEIGKGYAKGRIKLQPKHLNPYGSVHGGCLYSLADSVSGTAASTYGSLVSTITGTMNFIRPAMHTQYITCTATEVRQGKSVSVYNIEIVNDEGVLLENGTFTFYMLSGKPEVKDPFNSQAEEKLS